MTRASLVWLVCACSTSSAPPPIAPAPTPPPAPVTTTAAPATFAKLFEKGRRWTFATRITTHEWDDVAHKDKETKSAGTLACEVTYAGAIPQRWEATLACTASPKLPTQFPLQLVATPTGLWELSPDEPDAKLSPDAQLIAHPPKASSDHQVHEAAEGSQTTTVSNQGSRWCFGYQEAIAGHVSGWTLCVRDGDLVGGGSEGNDGGLMTIVRWGDVDE